MGIRDATRLGRAARGAAAPNLYKDSANRESVLGASCVAQLWGQHQARRLRTQLCLLIAGRQAPAAVVHGLRGRAPHLDRMLDSPICTHGR